MNLKYHLKYFSILFFFFITLPAFGSLNNSQTKNLNIFIEGLSKQLDMTGLSVVITKEGEIIYEKNIGFKVIPSQDEKGISLKEGDLFRIASISKTFIATIILRLEEEGKLNLKDDAQNYLSFPLRNPYWPNIPITIESLLTHTSSINDSQKYNSLDIINPQKNNNFKESFSNTKPGTNYKYCNFNYNLLGAIIENITGERFDEVIEDIILKPLDIKGGYDCCKLDSLKFVNLYTFNSTLNKYDKSQNAYTNNSKELEKYDLGISSAILSPCGGMKISAKDLAKYMNMHINMGTWDNKNFISKENENLMRKNYVGKNNYGYSFRQYKSLCPIHTMYGQTGGAYGLRSAMIFDPEDKIGFVILSSGSKSKYIDGSVDIHYPIIKKFYSILNQ